MLAVVTSGCDRVRDCHSMVISRNAYTGLWDCAFFVHVFSSFVTLLGLTF
jgi:hypothetical protein